MKQGIRRGRINQKKMKIEEKLQRKRIRGGKIDGEGKELDEGRKEELDLWSLGSWSFDTICYCPERIWEFCDEIEVEDC